MEIKFRKRRGETRTHQTNYDSAAYNTGFDPTVGSDFNYLNARPKSISEVREQFGASREESKGLHTHRGIVPRPHPSSFFFLSTSYLSYFVFGASIHFLYFNYFLSIIAIIFFLYVHFFCVR